MTPPRGPHFRFVEFECHDGTPVPERLWPNLQKLIDNLEILREAIGVPIHIHSGYRTPAHNKSVNGRKMSQHMFGRAADIVVDSMTPRQVADKIEELIAAGKMQNGGLGRYNTFTHYDVRQKSARWNG